MRPHYALTIISLFCAAVFLLVADDSHAQYPGFDAPGTTRSGNGASGLVASKPTIDGGAVSSGGTAQVVVLFRNEGGQPIQTSQINIYPSSNVSASVSMDQCSKEPIEPGAECALAVAVKGLQAGPWRAELLMLHSGRARLVTATLTGTVDASSDSADKLSSDIETIPGKVEFGTLSSGQTMVESVILRNITSTTIKISDIAISSSTQSGYSVQADCEELMAGEACVATVTWAPKQKGPSTGVLVIKHDGPTSVASVSLVGDYGPDSVTQAELFPEAVPGKGLIVSSQTGFDFGSDIAIASTITVSLVNTGDAAVTIKDIKLSGTNNGLSVSSAGCSSGLVLEPIEACPLTLTWSPTRVGNLLDDIQVLHDGARGVLVLPIRGVSSSQVSQDQKAIILTDVPGTVIGQNDVMDESQKKPPRGQGEEKPPPVQNSTANVANAASVLDGLRITSFATTRAIINGPGGSRLVYDGEQIMLGGVVWDITIQKNGIEFKNGANHVLLLFDRSLSSINRNGAKSEPAVAASSLETAPAAAQ